MFCFKYLFRFGLILQHSALLSDNIQLPANWFITSLFSVIIIIIIIITCGDRGSTVVKVLGYKSEGRRFDPSWCHWIFH